MTTPPQAYTEDQAIRALKFVRMVAALTKDGEIIDGEEFCMECDDAVDSMNNLIGRARDIVGGNVA